MSRKGISHLDFILVHDLPPDSVEFFNFSRFLRLTWKHPQPLSSSDREAKYQRYEKDPIIQQSIDALPAIFSLPMALIHTDFGVRNVMSELSTGPKLRSNLLGHSIEKAGNLDADTIQTIKAATIVGLLRSRGFTSRLGNNQEPDPSRDDESGAYKMLGLDGLLLTSATKLVD
ncbi:hypothetical protein N7488_001888 [Penicillium malachiteum]|nr:hypothetical protein N7488_001888 [Penicillium malachiteum]